MPVEQVDKGSYILEISMPTPQRIVVGRLGEISFSAGWYAYVGSAMGGFNSRLPHYLRKIEKPHWHIDYLLQTASVRRIVINAASERMECRIAGALFKIFEPILGFGCSDCKCISHLFYSSSQRELKSGLAKAQLIQPDLAGHRFLSTSLPLIPNELRRSLAAAGSTESEQHPAR